mgnify:CR=1 FL=1
MDELEKKYYTMRTMQMTIETIDTILRENKIFDPLDRERANELAKRRQILLDKLLVVGAK